MDRKGRVTVVDGVAMTCQEFLARHSEYMDGELDPREASHCEAHVASCPSCARYDRVVRSGLRLLHRLPEVEPSSDFFPRLQHRIFHLEEERRSEARTAGVGALASLAVAGALAVLAWSPLLRLGLGEQQAAIADQAVAEAAAPETDLVTPASGSIQSVGRQAPSIAGGGSVQLAAEAKDLPRIEIRSSAWGVGEDFGPSDPALSAWWWNGMATSQTVSNFRTVRRVDFRTPGPYSPLIVDAPSFRRTTILTRPADTRTGRD